MIMISGEILTLDNIAGFSVSSGIQRKILEIQHLSTTSYSYVSLQQLSFELSLRVKVIEASIDLNKSQFAFSTFRKSKCNSDYWNRSEEGSFRLKADVKSFDAISDIFSNGNQYTTECATAIVIVFYKAVGDLFPEELFNRLFANIYLMNWKEVDRNLNIKTYSSVPDGLPGDCMYFKNPDVNPLTPEWQGENAIDLGNDTYYGHGIGITTGEGIIEALNKNRKSGEVQSAYLMDSATRLGFNRLFNIYEAEHLYDISA